MILAPELRKFSVLQNLITNSPPVVGKFINCLLRKFVNCDRLQHVKRQCQMMGSS